jgi:hypothetical protein
MAHRDAILMALEVAILFATFVIYALPTMVALERGHHQAVPIIILNAFLGWTFVGWVGAFAWSTSAVRD